MPFHSMFMARGTASPRTESRDPKTELKDPSTRDARSTVYPPLAYEFFFSQRLAPCSCTDHALEFPEPHCETSLYRLSR